MYGSSRKLGVPLKGLFKRYYKGMYYKGSFKGLYKGLEFPKIRVPYFGVLIIRILLFRVLLGSPILGSSHVYVSRKAGRMDGRMDFHMYLWANTEENKYFLSLFKLQIFYIFIYTYTHVYIMHT